MAVEHQDSSSRFYCNPSTFLFFAFDKAKLKNIDENPKNSNIKREGNPGTNRDFVPYPTAVTQPPWHSMVLEDNYI